MTKKTAIKLVNSLFLLIALAALLLFAWNQNNLNSSDTRYFTEGSYRLSEYSTSADAESIKVYQAKFNNTGIRLISSSEITNESLNTGWAINKLSTIPTESSITSDSIYVFENSLFFTTPNFDSIFKNDLESGKLFELSINQEHPKIIQANTSGNNLVLLLEFNRETPNNQFIERTINSDTLKFSDKLLEIDLSAKTNDDVINELTGSQVKSFDSVDISARALDVWEFEKDDTLPTVYFASNGDYIVSNNEGRDLSAISFSGDFIPAFINEKEVDFLLIK